jgi:hypothetical protein
MVIKNGDVLAFSGKWFFSKLIQFWTKDKISHVGLAIWISIEGTDILCVLEAMEGKGVRIVPLSSYFLGKKPPDIYWCPINENQIDRQKVIAFALKNWNREYANIYQFILFMSPRLQWLRRLLGKSLDTDYERWHCSELITNALVEGGYPCDKVPALVSPGDVSRFSCLMCRGPISRDLCR